MERVALRVLFALFLLLASIRDYIFGNGLFIYRDWSWPLTTDLTPVAVFSLEVLRNSQADALGFTRLFLTWPIVVINALTGDFLLSEKAFVIYLFSLMIFLSYVLAELLLRLLRKTSNISLSRWRGEIFSLLIVLVSFANFWSLQQLSGLYFTAFVEFLLISISITVVLLWNANPKSALVSAALLSLATFLDPDLSEFGVLAVGTSILGTLLIRSFSLSSVWSAAKRIAILVSATLPSLLTVLYVLSETTGTNLRPAGTYQSAIVNLSLPNAFRLLGYWWSLIAYAPPSILGLQNQVQQLPTVGSPPYMVLPQGIVTGFWLATSWSLPVFSFASLILRTFRKITVPVSLIAVIGLLLTQPRLVPFPYSLADSLKDFPIVGGALTTLLAIPDHILVIVTSAYIILTAVSLYGLFSSNFVSTIRVRRMNMTGSFREAQSKPFIRTEGVYAICIAAILLLLLFPAWQFFSGSFYPSGYTDNAAGNGLSSVGAFSPSEPPQDMVTVYNWLLSRPSGFNVYWPGPDGRTYSWSEKTTPGITNIDSPLTTFHLGMNPKWFPAGLHYLISSNLTADVAPYLSALNMKYLVVQPFSEASMMSAWGVAHTSELSRILANSNGITLVYVRGDVSVYEVTSTWGSVYSPNVITSYTGVDQEYTVAYNLLASLGSRVAFVDHTLTPNRLCFDSLACTISILSPSFFNRTNPQAQFDALNSTNSDSGSVILQTGHSNPLPNPWQDWLVSNWGPSDASIQSQQGSTVWNFDRGTTLLSLSFNGTVTDNNPGGVAVARGNIAEVNVSFWYRTSDTFQSSVQIALPILNNSLHTVSVPVSDSYPASTGWREVEFHLTLPGYSSYFTPRIETMSGSGWIQIRNVQLLVNLFKIDPETPFGYSAPFITQEPISLGVFPYNLFLAYKGSGTIHTNLQTYKLANSTKTSWITIAQSNDQLIINGSVIIEALVATQMQLTPDSPPRVISLFDQTDPIQVEASATVVYARIFAPGFSLQNSRRSYSSHSSLDGMNVFFNVASGRYNLVFSALVPIQLSYFASLVFISAIVISSIAPPRYRKTVSEYLRLRRGSSTPAST